MKIIAIKGFQGNEVQKMDNNQIKSMVSTLDMALLQVCLDVILFNLMITWHLITFIELQCY
jgi:hypothetical protein